MKAFKNNLRHSISMITVLAGLLFVSTACENECVSQWSECYNRCPTQEEGDRAVGDCIEGCRAQYSDMLAFSKCAVACYNRSREACVDQCGDQLQRCLD
ncbi:hypothetical protein [Catalinimonas niigatensis]|uniref:hypothetical protein n=1 Tax=Catalinimonas niigatensis TaxID=1397264 RepID=UPI0026658115|nr:hypothetical protein [Catalinimonas niigatensis]WPP49474.1 hypothetical protein PZB72_22650 [Catalinimonas niigatensis]